MSLLTEYINLHPFLDTVIKPTIRPSLDEFDTFHLKLDMWVLNLKKDEPILIFGDYDADGLFSAAIAQETLQVLGYRTTVYIPDRIKDGYGFQEKTYKERGFTEKHLLILDSGTNHSDFAGKIGINVLIVDHHEPIAAKLNTNILINPHLDYNGNYDFCTGSLMFLFVEHLAKTYPKLVPLVDRALVYAMITTLTDMCKLEGHNRAIVTDGLKRLRGSDIDAGLCTLIRVLCPNSDSVTEETVGWLIGPTINAAGRLLRPQNVIRLLSAKTVVEALPEAQSLLQYNNLRKEITRDFVKSAEVQAREQLDSSVLVVADASWHLGVLGLVASQISQQFNKPTFAFGKHISHEHWTGSGRAPEGMSILNVAKQCHADILPGFGGHAGAMGLRVLDPVRLRQAVRNVALGAPEGEKLWKPLSKSVGDLTVSELLELETLRPFGYGNPKPSFHLYGTVVSQNQSKSGNGSILQVKEASGTFTAYTPDVNPLLGRTLHCYGQFAEPSYGKKLPMFFMRNYVMS